MFRKIIVGHDGLAGGEDALALAQALAPDAELVLATVYPYDSVASRIAMLGYGNALREETARTLRHIRDEANLPGARVETVPDTSPAHGLHGLAETERADLIVIGSSRRGPIGRVLLGDVSRAMLHGSPCPVAVAPNAFTAGRPRTIGVAYDDEPEARAALAIAADLAHDLGADLEVEDVIEYRLLPAYGGYPLAFDLDQIREDLRKDAQRRLDIACRELPVPVTATAVIGSVADELGALADNVDLLMCGSRSWGGLRRVVLGSTADRMIHLAHCPVLVVPRGSSPVELAASTVAASA